MTPPDAPLEHLLATPADHAARIGRRRFLGGAGAIAGASAVGASAVGTLAMPSTAHAALPAGASNFFILAEPYRAADTRPGRPEKKYTTVSDRQIRVKIAGVPHPGSTPAKPLAGVPADATAVVLTVTGIKRGTNNNIRAYPTGLAFPLVSNLNLAPSANSANMVTVKLGGGSVEVAANRPCNMIVDVLGYYRAVNPGVDGGKVREGRYVSLASPWRAYDSKPYDRPGGRYTTVDLAAVVPSEASSVVINLTAARVASNGYFSALPASATEVPSTSNLNVAFAGETRAGAAVVPLEPGSRKIKIYGHTAARIIVDVFGYYTSASSSSSTNGLFVPMNPIRIRDTRNPGDPVGRLWPNWVVETQLPAAIRATAAAVVVNVTGVAGRSRGHLRVSGARQPIPPTSNVNWSEPGANVPNHVITGATHIYGIQAFTNTGAHVLFDLAGYFLGTPLLPKTTKYLNPAPPPSQPEWTLIVPRLGLVSRVLSGPDADPIVDAGHSWHWTGTGWMGQEAHVAVFGHRTEYGGPYRYVHNLQYGDTALIRTQDGREFTYRYVRRDIVLGAEGSRDPGTKRVLAATRYHPGTTLSLISCTEPNGLPTDVDHRRIDTFALVSWREV